MVNWSQKLKHDFPLPHPLEKKAILQGKKEECHWIWSLPRKTALPAYTRVGFKKRGKWLDKDVEFGPNCLVTRQLIYK